MVQHVIEDEFEHHQLSGVRISPALFDDGLLLPRGLWDQPVRDIWGRDVGFRRLFDCGSGVHARYGITESRGSKFFKFFRESLGVE
jgi:hypothetical protein